MSLKCRITSVGQLHAQTHCINDDGNVSRFGPLDHLLTDGRKWRGITKKTYTCVANVQFDNNILCILASFRTTCLANRDLKKTSLYATQDPMHYRAAPVEM